MAQAVLMPKVGISVESCIITHWCMQPGDTVAEGDILFEYETDKSALECESTAAGVLLEQFFAEGDEVPVLVPVCAVGQPGEDTGALRQAEPESEKALPVQQKNAPQEGPVQSTPEVSKTGGSVSPRARKVAAVLDVPLGPLSGTGPGGRIIERDVRTAAQNPGSGTGIGGRTMAQDAPASTFAQSGGYKDIAFSGIRRAISKSMSYSLSSIPQLTHNFSFDATAILDYRAMIKKQGETMGLPDITLGDVVLFAVSRVLPRYPELNAHMLDETTIRQFDDVNLGVAVDTPRGLMVPNIKQANRKSLGEISLELKALAAAAQEGSISPDDLKGGTFTVSNLGALGVESFTPVINPPETSILGVDAIVERPRLQNGVIQLYPAMGISLTYDHRAIDGAPASRFAQELCRTLENFALLLTQ